MTISRSLWNRPFYSGAGAEGGAGGGGSDGGQPGAAGDQGQKPADQGAVDFDPAKVYAELDADSRAWLQKNEPLLKDPKALAQHAFNQEKLIGTSIRVPGEKATDEEKAAFLDKLGRPKTPDDYKLVPPKDLPEDLPYDGEFAKAAAAKAHELGLTQAQLAGLHDLFVGYQVQKFGEFGKQRQESVAARAKTETEKLEKLWGPLNGEQAKAQLEIADKVFTQTGKDGADFIEALTDAGLVGPNKLILDARIAPFIAKIGTALYTEDGVLRGRADEVGNPFAGEQGVKDSGFNLTKAMKIAKEDPDRARSLITAAGKKPADFGL
jgi:hypothetical protein